MAVSIDTSKDYLLVEDPETVTYYSKTQEKPPVAGVSVPYAKRFAIDKRRMTSDSLLAKAELFFRFWRIPLNGIVPKEDDSFVDANNVRFIIKDVSELSRSRGQINSWRCACIRDPRTV